MTNGDVVTVEVAGGPSIEVPWVDGMNAQQALEGARTISPTMLSFGLQYFGPTYGYMVFMVNETYDTYVSSSDPFYYWQFLIDGTPATSGIDNTYVDPGTTVAFAFTEYDSDTHAGSLLEIKHKERSQG